MLLAVDCAGSTQEVRTNEAVNAAAGKVRRRNPDMRVREVITAFTVRDFAKRECAPEKRAGCRTRRHGNGAGRAVERWISATHRGGDAHQIDGSPLSELPGLGHAVDAIHASIAGQGGEVGRTASAMTPS
ncbi:hypothetical protein GCM10010377_40590 [Streptomyces viridiviolaceus]|nr:hypothetical protein GCM10010377_40590 [Streptomyces viridiviolaceus]